MKKKELIEYHQKQIEKHRRALRSIGFLKHRFQLPTNLPFVIFSNYLNVCPKCNNAHHTFVSYKHVLICCNCARKKFGKMLTLKNWEVVKTPQTDE